MQIGTHAERRARGYQFRMGPGFRRELGRPMAVIPVFEPMAKVYVGLNQNDAFSPGFNAITFVLPLPSAAEYSAGVPFSCGVVP